MDAEKVRDIRAVRDNFVKKNIFGDFAVVYIILRYDKKNEQKGHPRLTN